MRTVTSARPMPIPSCPGIIFDVESRRSTARHSFCFCTPRRLCLSFTRLKEVPHEAQKNLFALTAAELMSHPYNRSRKICRCKMQPAPV